MGVYQKKDGTLHHSRNVMGLVNFFGRSNIQFDVNVANGVPIDVASDEHHKVQIVPLLMHVSGNILLKRSLESFTI